MCGRGALLQWRFGRGAGDGPPGNSGKGREMKSVKEGVEEMNRAACRGAVHRSAGARSVKDSSGRRKGAPLCAGRSHNPRQAADGALPTRWR